VLVGADLREQLRQSPSLEALLRLLRFYRRLLELDPPLETTFESTPVELVDFLATGLPEAMPEAAEQLRRECARIDRLATSLRDITGYAETNPIYIFTDLGEYHEQRRLAFRGDLLALLDTMLAKLVRPPEE